MSNKKETNEELKEEEMIDEGGLASEEDLFNKKAEARKEDEAENEELRQQKKMDDEGALGVDEHLFHDKEAQKKAEQKREQ